MNTGMTYRIRKSASLLCLFAVLSLTLAMRASGGYATVSTMALASSSYGEYEIKAGFIYKFLSFVSWPGDKPDSGRITIAVLGKNPFGNAFKSVEGSAVGSRIVNIRFFENAADYDELKKCQVIFISSSMEKGMPDILRAIGDSPVLTVGDTAGFIDNGGMIGFVKREKDKIGVEINAAAAVRSRLTIRSMLKRLAVRIIDEPDRPKEAQSVDGK